MSSFTANLSACETAVSGAGALSSGRIRLLLPPPGNANNGSVLLTANLGTSSSGTTCTSVGGGTVSAAGASRTYLQGNWAGSATYADNPSARATFGTFKGSDEVIFIRENF
jgi:MSHA biogenesis protein MshQ